MNVEPKEILFSVTAADCEWSYTRGTGAGGQKKNKTSSAVHCIHRPSGSRGYAEDTRSQAKNREIAFERMAQSKEFKKWHQVEVMRRTGQSAIIEARVAQEMKRVRVDRKNEKGLWEEWQEVMA